MNEAEIDALMAGQEDENGCVNYEGKPQIFFTDILYTLCIIQDTRLSLLLMLFSLHLLA